MAHPSSSRFHGLLIADLVLSDVKLGRGSDATVYKVDWNGTECAAKRLHDILLEDESPGGADKLIGNFEAECLTWSKLRHPGVVQFLGVYLERSSRLPVLIMERMDTSLRMYLEDHSKEEFNLHLKVSVLRQVTQALAYLHCQNPPLVHHDLSPNNILLNVVSCVTKVSDFGMSRAISPSALSRKSSIKGTLAYMAPEALHDPPRYNDKLDVFSFGNIIISTLTHQWPNPGPPTRYDGDMFVAITELQRRERFLVMFTAQEKQLFLPVVCQCLENRPDKRPSSVMLVQELRRIESSLLKGSQVATPIEQLRQQLSAKEEECTQKDEVIREKEESMKEKEKVIREREESLREKDEVIMEKDEVIREREEALKEKDEVIREKEESLREKDEMIREREEALKEKDEVIREREESLREKDEVIMEREESLREKDDVIREKDEVIKEREEALIKKDEVIQEKDVTLTEKETELQHLQSARKESAGTAQGLGKPLAVAPKVKHPFRDWKKLGECQKVIQHSPEGGRYTAVAVNIEGLLAVTDGRAKCIHLLTKEGALVRSIGNGVIGDWLPGVAFDMKGNIWIADWVNNKVDKLFQDGQLLHTVGHASSESDSLSHPSGVSVSPESKIYICDRNNDRVTVHDEEGKFLFAFGSRGKGPACFDSPRDIAFGSDGLVYITDNGNERVSVWSKEGSFKRNFKIKYDPTCIAATSDGHLLITSYPNHSVMVYTLEGELIHDFGGKGSHTGRLNRPRGICVDGNGVVYVADSVNNRVQFF